MSIQVSIDGLRLIADRHGDYAGQEGPYWCGEDGLWLRDADGEPLPWLAKTPPQAAMVRVLRHSFARPLAAIARWDSYVQTTKEGVPNRMWQSMPDLMLGKVAESLALRRAFPAELSGLYSQEEMAQAAPEADPMADWADMADVDSLRAAVKLLTADDKAKVSAGTDWPRTLKILGVEVIGSAGGERSILVTRGQVSHLLRAVKDLEPVDGEVIGGSQPAHDAADSAADSIDGGTDPKAARGAPTASGSADDVAAAVADMPPGQVVEQLFNPIDGMWTDEMGDPPVSIGEQRTALAGLLTARREADRAKVDELEAKVQAARTRRKNADA
jgi:hypothetical protein